MKASEDDNLITPRSTFDQKNSWSQRDQAPYNMFSTNNVMSKVNFSSFKGRLAQLFLEIPLTDNRLHVAG